eukprot:360850-Chlamydomonas_euryale.AAC.4
MGWGEEIRRTGRHQSSNQSTQGAIGLPAGPPKSAPGAIKALKEQPKCLTADPTLPRAKLSSAGQEVPCPRARARRVATLSI